MTELFFLIVAGTVCLLPANRLSSKEGGGFSGRWIGDLTAFCLVSWFSLLLLVLTDRFLSSVFIGLTLIALLFAGNRLKMSMLDEPLVFSDVFLAGHACRYPRLYFGYAPLWFWPLLLGTIALLGWGILSEKPMGWPAQWRWLSVAGLLTVPFLLGLAALRQRIPAVKGCPLVFDANLDANRYTPLGAALLHLMHHARKKDELLRRYAYQEPARHERTPLTGDKGGHLLLIQAESFCDFATLTGRPCVMPFFESLKADAALGRLRLDWKGAYTMRTEFSVLTGLAPRELETYGFDPYQLAARVPMRSLAREMKARGYKTVVWHPNDGRFFHRTQVMKNLGFDEFHDIGDFRDLPVHGRYASDEALLKRAAEFLARSEEPTFLFIITMEAHGPWDEGKFPEHKGLSEDECYEKHLSSFDRGLRELIETVSSDMTDATIIVYGDHLPGLRSLRRSAALEAHPDSTWFQWKKRRARDAVALPPQALSTYITQSFRE